MKRVFLFLFALVFWVGCGADREAEELASLRKAGDALSARDRALILLKSNPQRMAVWRELAAADEQLHRTLGAAESELRRTCLVEAALLCVAVTEWHGGKPPRDWSATCHLVREALHAQARSALYGVRREWRTDDTRRKDPFLEEPDITEEDDLDWPKSRSTSPDAAAEPWLEVNPADLERALFDYGCFSDLAQRLAGRRGEEEETMHTAEFTEWAHQFGVDLGYADRVIERARADVAVALGPIVQGLDDTGSFLPETVFQRHLQP